MRRHLGTSLLALSVLVLVGAALSLIARSGDEADRERTTQERVARIELLVIDTMAHSWQLRALPRVDPGLVAHARRDLAEVERLVAEIEHHEHDEGAHRDDPLPPAAERFDVASRAALDLLVDGRAVAALALQTDAVAPAAQDLRAVLRRRLAGEHAAVEAAQHRDERTAQAVVVLLGLLITGLWLSTLRRQRRLAADRAAALEHLAAHDALTGLPNRRALGTDLATAGIEAPVRLVLFDLDGFKGYNDAFGHPEGDALLRRLARRLAQAAGDRARAYRLGGDEFCVLVPHGGTDPDEVVRRCTAALHEAGPGFAIGTSVGVVDLPAEADGPTAALALADQRLYHHKGGNRSSARQQVRDVALRLLDEQHPALHDHVTGVADLARAVGERLGMAPEDLGDVVRAAELHDIGKVAVPAAILHKPGPLDDEEWAIMRRHTVIGANVLAAAPALARVAPLVRSSHERWDGRGYPDGLAGAAIPLGARIVFACDAFDAMTSDRPYHRSRTPEEALAEIERCAGSQFDPVVAAALVTELRARSEAPALAA